MFSIDGKKENKKMDISVIKYFNNCYVTGDKYGVVQIFDLSFKEISRVIVSKYPIKKILLNKDYIIALTEKNELFLYDFCMPKTSFSIHLHQSCTKIEI